MIKNPFSRTFILMSLLITAMLVACGNEYDETSAVDEPVAAADTLYTDWKTYTYGNIKILYPEGHPHADNLYDMANRYAAVMRQDCLFLGIDPPTDTVNIYFYTGFGQGRKMTGEDYPFADSLGLHFWLPGYYGLPMVKYLIPRWQPAEPRHEFLKHGLLALLDNTGENYHLKTLEYINNSEFIHLRDLAVDTTIDANTERVQSAMAASFVDFIVYFYGINGLNSLYVSDKDFDTTVESIFRFSVDSLENTWLNVIREMDFEAVTAGE